MTSCPYCNHILPDSQPADLRESVAVRGKRYAVKSVRPLTKSKTGRYYLRAVPVIELEPKKEG